MGNGSDKASDPTSGTGAETGEGERRLTNLLHLAELLQAASGQLDGEQALVRWLASQMEAQAAEGGADDTQVLRLESDADLVQIVTVHKSKGLEYPLVFLPFPAQFRAYDRHSGSAALTLPDGQGKLRLVLDPTDDDLVAADKERLREDVRLLYVALTRVRHALWIGATALKVGNGKESVWHRSAIGTLISGVEPRTPEELTQDVRDLATHPGILVEDLRADPVTNEAGWPARTWLQRREGQPPLSVRPDYDGRFERNWAIRSYSALVRAAGRAEVMAGSTGDAMAAVLPTAADGLSVTSSVRVVRDDEPLDDSLGGSFGRAGSSLPVGLDALGAGVPQDGAAEQGVMRLAADPWHRFPRGAFAGNFLHGLLEWLAGEQFALDDSPTLQEALVKRCEQQGWGHRSEDVLAWLKVVCATPLPELDGASLRDLEGTMPEMEFWYPSQGLRTKDIDRLCRAHLMAGRERPELADRMLNGMLMGFADLVFEHSGRYWVLDYKSNALGLDDAAYSVGAMEEAVLTHRYDVQASLYELALHRLLRVRLGAAYDPDRHLGGTVFLFLRGMRSPASGCCVVPAPSILIDGLDAVLPQPGLELV